MHGEAFALDILELGERAFEQPDTIGKAFYRASCNCENNASNANLMYKHY